MKILVVFDSKLKNNQPPDGQGYFAEVSDTIHVKLLDYDPDLLTEGNQNSISLKANKKPLKIFQDLWGALFAEFQAEQAGLVTLKLKILTLKVQEKVRVLVQPRFNFHSESFEVKDIRMQTNLSRCLGPIENWSKVLSRQISLGFNFFHLTSVQKLGKFGSLYCIGDYSELNDCFFTQNDLTSAEKIVKLKDQVSKVEEMGAGMIIDLVLSHCSSINPIFSLSPDAAYTLNNTPHLTVAYELDSALKKLTKDMEESRTKFRYGNRIENEEHLQYTMEVLKKRIQDLRLFEFFCVDSDKMLEELVRSEVRTVDPHDPDLIQNFKEIGIRGFLIKYALNRLGVGRYQAEINFLSLWKNALNAGISREVLLREAIKEIQDLNEYSSLRFARKTLKILFNIEEEIRYHKLELRVFEVTKEKPLVRPYFTELLTGEPALLNGFIFSPKRFSPDISRKWNYLYRNVITWNDCVKINYGSGPSSCSAWLPVIENYVVSMGQIFAGFRLDNCHGTPLWLSSHLVQLGRTINPNLLVIAELFTDCPKMDSLYASSIGLNLIMRESLTCKSVTSLKEHLQDQNKRNFVSLEPIRSLEGLEDPWKSFQKLPFVLYDFTHDNPTVSQSRETCDATSNMAAVMLAENPIASTRGYDEIIPLQLSVVDERRSYIEYPDPLLQFPCYRLMGVENGIQVFVELIDSNSKHSTVDIFGDWDGWKVALKLEPLSQTSLKENRKIWRCALEFPKSQQGMKYGFKFCSDKHQWFCDTRQKHYTTWDGYTNNVLVVEKNLPCLPMFSQNLHHLRYRMNLLREVWRDFGYSNSEIIELSDDIVVGKKENPETFAQFWVFCRVGFRKSPPVRLNFHLNSLVEKFEMFCRIQITGKYEKNRKLVNGIPVLLKELQIDDVGRINRDNRGDSIDIDQFLVGDVLVVKTRAVFEVEIQKINKHLDAFHDFLFDQLSFHDFHVIFWGSRKTENGIYDFPGTQQAKFGGIKEILLGLKDYEQNTDHPIIRNLTQGNWYIDYFLKRMQDLQSKVLYFYLNDIFINIKQLPRDLVPVFVIKTLKKLEKSSTNYISQHMLKCTFIPDSLKIWFLQVWKKDLKFLCDPLQSESLRFEHFWSCELLMLLELPEHAKELLISLAFQLKECPKASTSIHFLYQLVLYIEKDSLHIKIMQSDFGTEKIQDFCIFLLNSMLNSSFDPESGLVLAGPGESWCKRQSRTGAFIELSSMLYRSVLFFKDLPDFPESFTFFHNKESVVISLKDWAELIQGSFKDLYFIPSEASSRFIRAELVRETGIFKDTLGCGDEELEYLCSMNQLLAFIIAPQLFDLQVTLKMWKKCCQVLGNEFFVMDFDRTDAPKRTVSRAWIVLAGVKIGGVRKKQVLQAVKDFLIVIQQKDGLCDIKDGEFSGLAYLALFSLLKVLNEG